MPPKRRWFSKMRRTPKTPTKAQGSPRTFRNRLTPKGEREVARALARMALHVYLSCRGTPERR